MPRLSELQDVEVVNVKGKPMGLVTDVLFHPGQPRAIAVVVRRPRIGGLVARADAYIPLGILRVEGGKLHLDSKGLPAEKDGIQMLGYSWDVTVHWAGMPVRSADGEQVGAVSDVTFALEDGAVTSMRVSTGVLGDVAVGRLEVPGNLVQGFSGDAVIVSAGYSDLAASGGVAKAAAKGAGIAKDVGGRVAKQAYDAGMSAAVAVGKSFKSGTGRRMLDKFKEMTREEEE